MSDTRLYSYIFERSNSCISKFKNFLQCTSWENLIIDQWIAGGTFIFRILKYCSSQEHTKRDVQSKIFLAPFQKERKKWDGSRIIGNRRPLVNMGADVFNRFPFFCFGFVFLKIETTKRESLLLIFYESFFERRSLLISEIFQSLGTPSNPACLPCNCKIISETDVRNPLFLNFVDFNNLNKWQYGL